jgi:hypothetical protein
MRLCVVAYGSCAVIDMSMLRILLAEAIDFFSPITPALPYCGFRLGCPYRRLIDIYKGT